ncbi:MAG: hypothetical protein AAF518_04390 [Spirochaetota bacterium]
MKKIIIVFGFLCSIYSCKESEQKPADLSKPNEKQQAPSAKSGCIQFSEGRFSAEFIEGCFNGGKYAELVKGDPSCIVDSLVLKKNGTGVYHLNPDENVIRLTWKKEGESINLLGKLEFTLDELTECYNTCAEGSLEPNCNEKCKTKIIDKYGKESASFTVSGSLIQSGKDILFSLSGKNSNPISGKAESKFPDKYTKKNNKVCTTALSSK